MKTIEDTASLQDAKTKSKPHPGTLVPGYWHDVLSGRLPNSPDILITQFLRASAVKKTLLRLSVSPW